jgi:hypothetical protein
MNSSQLSEKRLISLLRWLTRIMTVILLLVVLLFVISEGFPFTQALTLAEKLGFAALAIILAGFVFGWKYEAAGGLLVIAGYIFFCIINRRILGLGVFSIFPVVGLSFLFCWWRTKTITAGSKPESTYTP